MSSHSKRQFDNDESDEQDRNYVKPKRCKNSDTMVPSKDNRDTFDDKHEKSSRRQSSVFKRISISRNSDNEYKPIQFPPIKNSEPIRNCDFYESTKLSKRFGRTGSSNQQCASTTIPNLKERPSIFSRLSQNKKSMGSTHIEKPFASNHEKISNRPILYGYGDSFIGTLSLLDENVVKIEKFKGASARGLNNPDSTLGVGENFKRSLSMTRPRNVFMMFGNVDLHMNFIYQLQTKGGQATSADEFQKLVFNQYTQFIEKHILTLLFDERHSQTVGFIDKLFISSVIYPVVEDKYLELSMKKYAENVSRSDTRTTKSSVSVNELLRKNDGCNLETRRLMVSSYNSLLRQWVEKHPNVIYIDINQYITEESSYIVRQEFRDKDPTNIHLLWEPTIGFWLKEFNKHGLHEVTAKHIMVDLGESARAYAEEKYQRMRKHPITSVLLREKK